MQPFASKERRFSTALAVAAAFLAVLGASPLGAQEPKKPLTFGASTAVERGRYLVAVMGCNDCHTPMKMGANGPEPDMSRMLSGHPESLEVGAAPKLDPASAWGWAGTHTLTAFSGPWGISFSANLTPDAKTGIGSWTEEVFIKAIRTGKHLGVGRPIMPPMPWMWYARATDDDLKAIFAYLKSVPPTKNLVPLYRPPAAPPKK